MQKIARIAPVLAAFAAAVLTGSAAVSQDHSTANSPGGYRTAPVMVSQVGGSAITDGRVAVAVTAVAVKHKLGHGQSKLLGTLREFLFQQRMLPLRLLTNCKRRGAWCA